MTDDTTQLPPNDIQTESILLACILVAPKVIDDVRIIVPHPEMFWRTTHQYLYHAILELHDDSTAIDWATVVDQLRRNGNIKYWPDENVAIEDISLLPDGAFSGYGSDRYAEIVRDVWQRRRLLADAMDMRGMVFERTRETPELIEIAEQKLTEISEVVHNADIANLSDVVSEVTKRREAMEEFQRKHRGELPGLSSGLVGLDQLTTGWKGGQVILVAARPGVGKTSLLLDFAAKAREQAIIKAYERGDKATENEGGPLFVSLEMTKEELVERTVCSIAGIDSRLMKLGLLNNEDRATVIEVEKSLSEHFWIIDDFNLDMPMLRSLARRAKRRHKITSIFVDYVQLFEGPSKLDRHVVLGQVSRGLKKLAKELDVPIIAAAQLNRDVEKGVARKPRLSDLRESGSLEQDADAVLFIHQTSDARETGYLYDEVTLIQAKNRAGPTGDVDCHFIRAHTHFLEVERRPQGDWHSANERSQPPERGPSVDTVSIFDPTK